MNPDRRTECPPQRDSRHRCSFGTGMLVSKVQMVEQIARDSISLGHENNAIGANRLLAEITGFGVEHKR